MNMKKQIEKLEAIKNIVFGKDHETLDEVEKIYKNLKDEHNYDPELIHKFINPLALDLVRIRNILRDSE